MPRLPPPRRPRRRRRRPRRWSSRRLIDTLPTVVNAGRVAGDVQRDAALAPPGRRPFRSLAVVDTRDNRRCRSGQPRLIGGLLCRHSRVCLGRGFLGVALCAKQSTVHITWGGGGGRDVFRELRCVLCFFSLFCTHEIYDCPCGDPRALSLKLHCRDILPTASTPEVAQKLSLVGHQKDES